MSRQVLDEQIDVEWYQMLKQRRSFDKVGDGFGRKGLQDEEICHLLHGTGKTFHSQDSDYYHPRNRHKSYCLVYYEVKDSELVDISFDSYVTENLILTPNAWTRLSRSLLSTLNTGKLESKRKCEWSGKNPPSCSI